MADLKMWNDLSESEQRNFAARVAGAKTQGWEDLARLAEEAGIEPDEDTLPTIYELTDLFLRTQEPLFYEREGDRIFAYDVGDDFKCRSCNYPCSSVKILAPTQAEADRLRKEEHLGICGDCMTALIDDTNAEVVTRKEFVDLEARDFWKATIETRDGEHQYPDYQKSR